MNPIDFCCIFNLCIEKKTLGKFTCDMVKISTNGNGVKFSFPNLQDICIVKRCVMFDRIIFSWKLSGSLLKFIWNITETYFKIIRLVRFAWTRWHLFTTYHIFILNGAKFVVLWSHFLFAHLEPPYQQFTWDFWNQKKIQEWN